MFNKAIPDVVQMNAIMHLFRNHVLLWVLMIHSLLTMVRVSLRSATRFFLFLRDAPVVQWRKKLDIVFVGSSIKKKKKVVGFFPSSLIFFFPPLVFEAIDSGWCFFFILGKRRFYFRCFGLKRSVDVRFW